jgi:hypothetical protein
MTVGRVPCKHSQVLDSWNDTATSEAIVDFVEVAAVRIPPEARVATFDNDGTLWCEKPMPIQLDFTIRRFAQIAEADPSLRDQQPYRAAYEQDLHWLGAAMTKHYQGDDHDMRLLLEAVPKAFGSVAIEDYEAQVTEFLASARHPTLGRPYLQCAYAPMIELLQYLAANEFTVYIASGGDRDFMRPFAQDLYGIPPERIIGSALDLEYHETEGMTDLLYKTTMDFFDDGPDKPIRIWSRVGRRPIAACGNSNGDVPMLRFARTAGGPGLRLLLLHDDAEREFDYTAGAEDALQRAREHDWAVISIANDWKMVFAG